MQEKFLEKFLGEKKICKKYVQEESLGKKYMGVSARKITGCKVYG